MEGTSATSATQRRPRACIEGTDAELDCPWFDATWLQDHPEYPLATTTLVSAARAKEDGDR